MASARVCINFHGIGERPAAVPEHEAVTWLPADRFRRILDRAAEEPSVRLTFDDGHASDHETALPELLDRGLTATFFLVVDRIGEPGRIGADEVRDLVGAGMRIGSHGMRHRRWRGLHPDALASELSESRAALEELAGSTVDEAACPYGAYDRAVLSQARRSGYRRVFTSDGGQASPTAFVQPRTSVRAWDDGDLVDRLLRPGILDRSRRRAARQLRTWR